MKSISYLAGAVALVASCSTFAANTTIAVAAPGGSSSYTSFGNITNAFATGTETLIFNVLPVGIFDLFFEVGGSGISKATFDGVELALASVPNTTYRFTSHTDASVSSPYTVQIFGTAVRGAQYVGHLELSAVPEPAEYAMFLAGLAVVGAAARRKKQS